MKQKQARIFCVCLGVDSRITLQYLSPVTQSTDSPTRTAAKTSRDAPALSAEYHKARKQLMFWSAILLIWSLVGVDLEKAKEAEGGVGAVVNSIKSPQAVPWALVILAVYFAFKFTVEWYQCNAARRRLRASKADFISAWVVLALANILYFGQLISQVQFADALQKSNRWQSVSAGAFAGFLLGYSFTIIKRLRSRWHVLQRGYRLAPIMMITILLFSVISTIAPSRAWNWKYFVIACIFVAALIIIPSLYLKRWERNSRNLHVPLETEKIPTEH